MTSGTFTLASTSSIIVDREGRQRRALDPDHIASLAESISRLGLIHPIVIRRDCSLVAGECRLAAISSLGWDKIPAQYADTLDEAELKAIELEENIKRQDIDWKDRVRATQEYHNLRHAVDPDWNQEKTAEAIGLSRHAVGNALAVAEELSNERVASAPKYSVALGIVRRNRERQDEQTINSIKALVGAPADPVEAPRESILNLDFNEWIRSYTGPKFNFIHCDFPYGIGADEFNQGSATAHGGYADSEDTFWTLMDSLRVATETATTDSCHLMFWFAMRKGNSRLYEPTAKALESFGWDVNPMPLIWLKSDNVGIIPDVSRGPRQIYETAFIASRGDRKVVQAVANAYPAPTVRDRHMSEKPEPVLRHFFRMFCDQHTVMLDPTCGSGSSLRAAESLSARHVVGLEINREFAELANTVLIKARAARAASLHKTELLPAGVGGDRVPADRAEV